MGLFDRVPRADYDAACRARDEAREELADLTMRHCALEDRFQRAHNDARARNTTAFNYSTELGQRCAAALADNQRLSRRVAELEELLERKGRPLSWPSVIDPDEPSTVSTLVLPGGC